MLWVRVMGGVLICLWGTTAVHAQDAATGATPATEEADESDARARRLFDEAVVAYNDGDYQRSLRYFEDAYELSGRPELLYNIATSADRLRMNQRAIEGFEAYLEAVPEAANRTQVEARLQALRNEAARQAAIEASLEETQAELASQRTLEEEAQHARRRRRIIGGVAGAVLLVGAAVLTAVLVSSGGTEPLAQGDFVIQTLRRTP